MAKSYGYWPIIYVRGYAMSRTEIDETTADPFCGFNLGSTVIRATPDPKTPPRKLIFESPLVRLQSDFEYGDVYEDGVDIGDPDFTADITDQLDHHLPLLRLCLHAIRHGQDPGDRGVRAKA